jgi:hypothetical protein
MYNADLRDYLSKYLPNPVTHFHNPWAWPRGQCQDFNGAFVPSRIFTDPVGFGKIAIRMVYDPKAATACKQNVNEKFGNIKNSKPQQTL